MLYSKSFPHFTKITWDYILVCVIKGEGRSFWSVWIWFFNREMECKCHSILLSEKYIYVVQITLYCIYLQLTLLSIYESLITDMYTCINWHVSAWCGILTRLTVSHVSYYRMLALERKYYSHNNNRKCITGNTCTVVYNVTKLTLYTRRFTLMC